MLSDTHQYEGRTMWFEATYARYGGVNMTRILLTDVVIAGGRPVREHTWIPINKATQSIAWSSGKRYRFKAQVAHYHRGGYYDSNNKKYIPLYEKLGLRLVQDIREI